MQIFIGALFVIVCVLLIIIVLLQKGRGGGVSAAFGGGGSHSAFGTRTGDVLTWVTVVLVSVFIVLSLVAVLQWRPSNLEQARMPGFEPAGRYIDQPATIILTSSESDAKIYFTTDGTPPTRASEVYSTPLRIQPGATIKAFVSAPGWHDSNVVEMSYPRATAEMPVNTPTVKKTQPTGKAAAATKPAPKPGSSPALPAMTPAATLPAAK